jgi:Ser/Thr protein kinase RdoA (MazF antagonist)
VAKGPLTVPALPDGIAAHWRLERFPRPEALTGGYHTTLVRLGDVVLRTEDRAPESVAWEHELLAWLAPAVPEVVLPLPAEDGTTFLVRDGRTHTLLPFVAGEPGAVDDVAGVLARVHARGAAWPAARPRPGRPAYADLDWEENDWWSWRAVPKPPELIRAFERVRAWIASEPALVVTPIHGDPARQNVIARGGRVVGLVDWEWARLDWAGIELAIAAHTFAEDDPHSFVAAYRDAGGLGEADVLEEGLRIMLLANALYALTRGGENQDWVRYLLDGLRELP